MVLFFNLQDVAAKAGKDTCHTDLDIAMPVVDTHSVLQAKTSPKQVSATEVQHYPCKCKNTKESNGNCKEPAGKAKNCHKHTNRKDCENRKNKLLQRPCKWDPPTPEPTPKPTPDPTPEPTPEPTVYHYNGLYTENLGHKCWNGDDSWPFTLGLWTNDCKTYCDTFAWCKGYTDHLMENKNGDLVVVTCELVVDQNMYLEAGNSWPIGCSGTDFKLKDPSMHGLEVDVTKNCGVCHNCNKGTDTCDKCKGTVFGTGSLKKDASDNKYNCYSKGW